MSATDEIARLTAERDEAVEAISRLRNGEPFEAIVAAQTIASAAAEWEREKAGIVADRDAVRAAAKGLVEALQSVRGPGGLLDPKAALEQLSLAAADGGELNNVDYAAYLVLDRLIRTATALAAYAATGAGSFQSRVDPWMQACFGPEISADRVERGDRLVEEVFELLQSGGYDRARATALIDYVWSRPAGEPAQEVGGVMVTLAAYCLAHNLDMHAAGEVELARIWTKIEQIRAKQAAKPTGSALPIATGAGDAAEERGDG